MNDRTKEWATKVCRYNWHSARSMGWPFPLLKYKYIFQIKHTEAITSNTTRKLLWFEITKMPIAVKNKFIVSFNFRHTFVRCDKSVGTFVPQQRMGGKWEAKTDWRFSLKFFHSLTSEILCAIGSASWITEVPFFSRSCIFRSEHVGFRHDAWLYAHMLAVLFLTFARRYPPIMAPLRLQLYHLRSHHARRPGTAWDVFDDATYQRKWGNNRSQAPTDGVRIDSIAIRRVMPQFQVVRRFRIDAWVVS